MYLERRALPKSNKITYQRYVDKCQKLHRDRLKKIKSTLDNKAPKKHKHLRRNLKREQMMEGGCAACGGGGWEHSTSPVAVQRLGTACVGVTLAASRRAFHVCVWQNASRRLSERTAFY